MLRRFIGDAVDALHENSRSSFGHVYSLLGGNHLQTTIVQFKSAPVLTETSLGQLTTLISTQKVDEQHLRSATRFRGES